MLYTITPEQEKAALHLITNYTRDHNPIDVLQYSSLAEMMHDSNLSPSQLNDRPYVASQCIIAALLNVIADDNLYSGYEWYKSIYEKYSNQDLLGAIGGLSLTTDHFNEIMLCESIYSWYKQNFFVSSLFFDFATKSDKFNEFLDDFIENDGPNYNVSELLLFPSIYKFTEDKVQKIIESYHTMGNAGMLVIFAASPYTRDFLTKENFSAEYKSLVDNKMAFYNDMPSYSLNELNQAYQDLFGEELIFDSYQ